MGSDGKDHMKEEIEKNYYRIKADVKQIIQSEMTRIENDPSLRHLLEQTSD